MQKFSTTASRGRTGGASSHGRICRIPLPCCVRYAQECCIPCNPQARPCTLHGDSGEAVLHGPQGHGGGPSGIYWEGELTGALGLGSGCPAAWLARSVGVLGSMHRFPRSSGGGGGGGAGRPHVRIACRG